MWKKKNKNKNYDCNSLYGEGSFVWLNVVFKKYLIILFKKIKLKVDNLCLVVFCKIF